MKTDMEMDSKNAVYSLYVKVLQIMLDANEITLREFNRAAEYYRIMTGADMIIAY